MNNWLPGLTWSLPEVKRRSLDSDTSLVGKIGSHHGLNNVIKVACGIVLTGVKPLNSFSVAKAWHSYGHSWSVLGGPGGAVVHKSHVVNLQHDNKKIHYYFLSSS